VSDLQLQSIGSKRTILFLSIIQQQSNKDGLQQAWSCFSFESCFNP